MTAPFLNCTDQQLLTLCLYGEARGEGLDGMLAVGSVVMNRKKRSNLTVGSVVLAPKQFSCFNEEDPNYDQLANLAQNYDAVLPMMSVLRRCHWIARGIIDKWLDTNVGPSTHYHSQFVEPYWAKDPKKMRRVAIVGHHLFYEELK